MIKNCVFDANGKLINIGDWDYQLQPVKTGTEQVQVPDDYVMQGEEAWVDETPGSKTIERPIYEDQPTNPLPNGATTQQREIMQNPDGSWGLADLATVQAKKIAEIKVAVGAAIVSGYQSTVVLASTGKAHFYGTASIDQFNMKTEYDLMKDDPNKTVIQYRPQDEIGFVDHTREEFTQIAMALFSRVKGMLGQGYALANEVKALSNVDDVNVFQVMIT